MKLFIKKKIKNLIKSTQNELRKSIDRLEKVAVYEAAAFALKNLPAVNDQVIEPYITRLRGGYLSLRKDIKVALQAGLQKMLGAANIQVWNEKIDVIKNAIKLEIENRIRWKEDINRLQMFGKKTAYKKQQALLLVAGLADSFLLISGFLKIGDILLISVIVGGILGFLQTYCAKFAVQNIREVSNPKQQKIYYAVMTTFFIGLSIALGIFRHHMLLQTTGTDVSPIFFAVLNILPVAAASLLTLFYYPSKKEIDELEAIEELQDNIDQSIAHQAKLEKKKDELVEQRQHVAQLHGEFIHDEKELLAKVDADFDAAVGIWITENICKRSDNIVPPCFKVKHLPLSDSSDSSSFDQIK